MLQPLINMLPYLGCGFLFAVNHFIQMEQESPHTCTELDEAIAKYPTLEPKLKTLLKHTLTPFVDANLISHHLLDSFIEEEYKHFSVRFARYNANPEVAINAYMAALGSMLSKALEHEAPDDSFESVTALAKSFIWSQYQTHKARATGFIDRLADAHGFIQVTGWSTQNENSLFALFDLYNYWRYIDDLSEYRGILEGTLDPLYPIYYEYRDISQREKNLLLKVTRILMPMVITAGLLLAVSLLLTPFAIPEFAFIVLSIPTLYLGLFLSAQYVSLRNTIYHGIRRMWYGGIYSTPEFQLNERLEAAFGEHGDTIRTYYIDALKACDELEKQFTETDALSEEDLKHREENQNRRKQLLLEWFDVHSNQHIGYDKARPIVENRLKHDILAVHAKLQDFLQVEKAKLEALLPDIKAYLEEESPKLLEKNMDEIKPPARDIRFFATENIVKAEYDHIQTIQENITSPSTLPID